MREREKRRERERRRERMREKERRRERRERRRERRRRRRKEKEEGELEEVVLFPVTPNSPSPTVCERLSGAQMSMDERGEMVTEVPCLMVEGGRSLE